MPKHHYLPASFLSLFSNDKSGSTRQYKIFVGDRRTGDKFSTSVSNVGCVKNLYSLLENVNRPQLIDEIWSGYETILRDAIEKLIQNQLDAITWARVLVPFVACLLVRGPDADIRFLNRIQSLGLKDFPLSKDNTNYFRVFEIQRLLGPVAAARWIVSTCPGEDELITNDLACAPTFNPQSGEFGLTIPIGKSTVLILVPTRQRNIAYAKDGKWYPYIEYFEQEAGNFKKLNQVLAVAAQRFVFGSNAITIQRYLIKSKTPPAVPDPAEIGFISGRLSVVHEFTWHRLVSVLASQPDSLDAHNFSINWDAVAKGWHPPVYLPTNLPEFPSSLRRVGNDIHVYFFDVQGFTI